MLAGIDAALRQPRSLRRRAHRPWPVPERRWIMGQSWQRLLFAHWRVDAEALARVVPAALPLDTFDGAAWVGVTPFRVEGFRPRNTPPLPFLHAFSEVNVRTYVSVGGKPGIFFFSLDTNSRFAVESARRIYRVPYFRARQRMDERDGHVAFETERTHADGPPAELAIEYRAAGRPFEPAPGTLEHFLTERYCLYTLDADGRPLRGDIHHEPWTIRVARVSVAANTMGEQVGLELEDEPLVHLADRQDVVFWPLAPA